MLFHRIGFQLLRKTKHPKLLFFWGVTLGVISCKLLIISDFRGERGIRTPGASQHAGFQDRCIRPLYHLSFSFRKLALV